MHDQFYLSNLRRTAIFFVSTVAVAAALAIATPVIAKELDDKADATAATQTPSAQPAAVGALPIERPAVLPAKPVEIQKSDIEQARDDMLAMLGSTVLKPGDFEWMEEPGKAAGAAKLVVSISDQRAYLYRGRTLVAVTTVSTGRSGHRTPTGTFPITEKRAVHFSNKYDNAPMPHMQRLTNDGIALHAGYIPGKPASHGCVRLPAKFAAKLFAVTRIGTPVVISA